ncbi:M48 family metallopeptidase [Bradyrhizobium sp. AUGA SZCCT0177]|nr:M48 family metallopeptidase [Bradyrhizobium sp. AUGA SZCCT0177]
MIRVAEFRTGWGSCGAHGTVNIDWRLIFAPKRVLEYVVVHELAHLRYRSHGKTFWEYLGQIFPTYVASKAWLDAHQAGLDGDFFKTVIVLVDEHVETFYAKARQVRVLPEDSPGGTPIPTR